MVSCVAGRTADHGQALEISAQAIVGGHGDGAVKLDRFLAAPPPVRGNFNFRRRDGAGPDIRVFLGITLVGGDGGMLYSKKGLFNRKDSATCSISRAR